MTRTAPTVDVVIPVLNEERALPGSIRRLRDWMAAQTSFVGRITIVDNGSIDGTLAVATGLAAAMPQVRVLHLDQRGRGRALKHAWLRSEAHIVAYMDVDLSTELEALPRIVAALQDGADIAIGSRLARGSRVDRGVRRELISRCYNLMLRRALHVRFRDAQCGCKAMHASLARQMMGEVTDDGWFFDTELLVLAERTGARIAEIPVRWVEDTDSRVKVVQTAIDDVRGIFRLRRTTLVRMRRRAPSMSLPVAATTLMTASAVRMTGAAATPSLTPPASSAPPRHRALDRTRHPRPRGAVDRLPGPPGQAA